MLGQVTSVVSKHTMCVDDMPRHVRDVRQQRYGNDRGTGHVSYRLVSDIQPRLVGAGGNHFPEANSVDMQSLEKATVRVLPVGLLGEANGEAID